MLSPIFQSSTLSVRRQANAFIRAAAVVGNANPTTTTSSTSTYSTTATTTMIRPASTYTSTSFVVSQLHNTNNTNNNHRSRWFSDTTGTGKTTTATEGNEEDNDAVAEEEDGTTTTTTAEEGENAQEENENNEQEQVQQLKKELVDLKNQLLRSFAEQENIRTIARNDVKAAKDFSTKSFAKSMLEVADNLDRALESVVTSPSPPDESTTTSDTNNETLKSFVEGIELTNSGLLKALQSNGVEAYCEQPGDIFNPDQHQALMEYLDPDPTKSAGTIGVVMKKGYTLNKRVLRPAEVGVIKK